MFKANDSHRQGSMFNSIESLPEEELSLLETSWAATFYRECFCRIDEEAFACLYSDKPSRPNVPVNILLSLEILKAGFGWDDEELINHFYFDLQVRYALGLRTLGEGHFDIRTLYNFRRRLGQHMQETGQNLVAEAFQRMSDEQLEAFHLRAGRLRMDSTMVASNIREYSRLQLLVEVLQRVHRMLNDVDRQRYAEELAPYIQGTSGQYVHRVTSEEGRQHMAEIGQLMVRLVDELRPTYGEEPGYQVLERVFHEHFVWEGKRLRPKEGKELSTRSLNSPDDLEATFRRKRGKAYKGYVSNVTETCDPANDFQLIVKVQTEPNVTDDPTLLLKTLPELKDRLPVHELYTDGGYNNKATVGLARELAVDHIQTGLRGHAPQGQGLDAYDFVMVQETPEEVSCPGGQRVEVEARPNHCYIARFDPVICQTCPHQDQCRTEMMKSRRHRTLYFNGHNLEIALRRQRIRRNGKHDRSLRNPVESTIAAIKRPSVAGKLPVRGRFRVACTMLGAATMVNIRRIHRYASQTPTPKVAMAKALELPNCILWSLRHTFTSAGWAWPFHALSQPS
jgi:hypothetical protein